jgi:hypothetical protein
MTAEPIEITGHFVAPARPWRINARAAFVAWPAWGITAGLSAIAVVLILAMWSDPLPNRLGFRGWVPIAALLYATVGARIATRQSHNPVGWLILAVGIAYGLNTFAEEYAHYAVFHELRQLPLSDWAAAYAWTAPYIVTTLGGMAYLFFPDGKLPSRRWLPVATVVGALGVISIVGNLIAPQILRPYYIANPFAPDVLWRDSGDWETYVDVLYLLRIIVLVVPLVGVLIKLARAKGERRQQMKWVATAGILSTALFATYALGVKEPVLGYLMVSSIIAIPVALWIAITRYRLYEIDLILNRALVYAALTATLAGMYTASIGLFQKLFQGLTGENSDAAIILTTLSVAAAFTPVKNWLQTTVDSRFRVAQNVKGLSAFGSAVDMHLAFTDRERLLSMFLDETVGAFGAQGGALQMFGGASPRITKEAGHWNGEARLACAFKDGERDIARVFLGPRLNGDPYTEDHRARLRSVSEKVSEALRRMP